MKDLFSRHSLQYQAFRPTYPLELFDFIFSQSQAFGKGWDCATGNGQAAVELAKKFDEVFATDISQNQLIHAPHANNIHYSVASAEHTHFQDDTFDLITVAQAAHWLNLQLFYNEAKRVGKKGGLLALWGYGLLKIHPNIDKHIEHFYHHIVGPYWDAERKHIETHYRMLPFPFEELDAPPFTFSFQWSLAQLQGYLSTWSAVHKFKTNTSVDPVPALMEKIAPLWDGDWHKVTFPLFLRLGRL